MILRAVCVAAVLAVLVPGSERAIAGCSPNLAWQDASARPSPDGRWIAWVRNEVGCAPPPGSLFVAKSDGSQPRRLGATVPHPPSSPPAWSSDSRRLAFANGGAIEIVDVVTGRRDLVNAGGDTPDGARAVAPAWSRDGTRFAYRRPFGGVYVVDVATGARVRIAARANDHSPVLWSPTRDEIAFVEAGDIWIAAADGSGARIVVGSPATEADPTWAPDGERLAFSVSQAHDASDLYVVNRDGSGSRRLTERPGLNRSPAWSPDGKAIAYVHGATSPGNDPDRGVRLITPDGSTDRPAVAATPRPDVLGPPAWTSDASRLFYSAGGACLRYGVYSTSLSEGRDTRLTNRCVFRGTTRSETIRGTAFNDFLYGLPGNDRLLGGRYDDWLEGGSGNDVLLGGWGQDRLLGGDGNDVIVGDLGADLVHGGRGRDEISTGRGKDRIDVRDGLRDTVSCGPLSDEVQADRVDRVAADCENVARS